jgi:hypothetical protein
MPTELVNGIDSVVPVRQVFICFVRAPHEWNSSRLVGNMEESFCFVMQVTGLSATLPDEQGRWSSDASDSPPVALRRTCEYGHAVELSASRQ